MSFTELVRKQRFPLQLEGGDVALSEISREDIIGLIDEIEEAVIKVKEVNSDKYERFGSKESAEKIIAAADALMRNRTKLHFWGGHSGDKRAYSEYREDRIELYNESQQIFLNDSTTIGNLCASHLAALTELIDSLESLKRSVRKSKELPLAAAADYAKNKIKSFFDVCSKKQKAIEEEVVNLTSSKKIIKNDKSLLLTVVGGDARKQIKSFFNLGRKKQEDERIEREAVTPTNETHSIKKIPDFMYVLGGFEHSRFGLNDIFWWHSNLESDTPNLLLRSGIDLLRSTREVVELSNIAKDFDRRWQPYLDRFNTHSRSNLSVSVAKNNAIQAPEISSNTGAFSYDDVFDLLTISDDKKVLTDNLEALRKNLQNKKAIISYARADIAQECVTFIEKKIQDGTVPESNTVQVDRFNQSKTQYIIAMRAYDALLRQQYGGYKDFEVAINKILHELDTVYTEKMLGKSSYEDKFTRGFMAHDISSAFHSALDGYTVRIAATQARMKALEEKTKTLEQSVLAPLIGVKGGDVEHMLNQMKSKMVDVEPSLLEKNVHVKAVIDLVNKIADRTPEVWEALQPAPLNSEKNTRSNRILLRRAAEPLKIAK